MKKQNLLKKCWHLPLSCKTGQSHTTGIPTAPWVAIQVCPVATIQCNQINQLTEQNSSRDWWTVSDTEQELWGSDSAPHHLTVDCEQSQFGLGSNSDSNVNSSQGEDQRTYKNKCSHRDVAHSERGSYCPVTKLWWCVTFPKSMLEKGAQGMRDIFHTEAQSRSALVCVTHIWGRKRGWVITIITVIIPPFQQLLLTSISHHSTVILITFQHETLYHCWISCVCICSCWAC